MRKWRSQDGIFQNYKCFTSHELRKEAEKAKIGKDDMQSFVVHLNTTWSKQTLNKQVYGYSSNNFNLIIQNNLF